jgi:hypothetical protein
LGLQLNGSELKDKKINVEFTKSGKKTDLRMEKIKEKNEKASRFRMLPTETKGGNKRITFNEES